MSDKRGPCRGGRAPELLLVSMFYSPCGMENLEAESEHKTQVPRTSARGPMAASSLKVSWSLNLSALCGGSASCKEVPGTGQSSPAPASPSLPSTPSPIPFSEGTTPESHMLQILSQNSRLYQLGILSKTGPGILQHLFIPLHKVDFVHVCDTLPHGGELFVNYWVPPYIPGTWLGARDTSMNYFLKSLNIYVISYITYIQHTFTYYTKIVHTHSYSEVYKM